MGRGQASLGTLIPRTLTVAPRPKAHSGLASRRSQRSSAEHRGPQKPAALVDAWRLIGRGRLRFPTLPRQLPDCQKAGVDSACLHYFLSPCSDALSCALPLKSPDLLPSSPASASNGTAQGQVCLAAGLVRASSRSPQRFGEEPRRHALANGGGKQREGED